MIDPLIAAAFLVLWTVLAGTLPLGASSKKLAFWGSVAIALILGVLFTSYAYHIRHAYLSPLSPRSWMPIGIGLVWSVYLAMPAIILVKKLSVNPRGFSERLFYSMVAAFLQTLFF